MKIGQRFTFNNYHPNFTLGLHSSILKDDDDADDDPFGSFLLCASCASSSLALSSDTFTRIAVNAGKGFADTDNVLPLSDTAVDFLVISE